MPLSTLARNARLIVMRKSLQMRNDMCIYEIRCVWRFRVFVRIVDNFRIALWPSWDYLVAHPVFTH